MNDIDTLRKAVLFEILQDFDVDTKKINNPTNITLLNDIVGFHSQVEKFFKYKFIVTYDVYSAMIADGVDLIDDWCVDNDIVYIFENKTNYSINGTNTVEFTFTCKEDVTAFKLKWL